MRFFFFKYVIFCSSVSCDKFFFTSEKYKPFERIVFQGCSYGVGHRPLPRTSGTIMFYTRFKQTLNFHRWHFKFFRGTYLTFSEVFPSLRKKVSKTFHALLFFFSFSYFFLTFVHEMGFATPRKSTSDKNRAIQSKKSN